MRTKITLPGAPHRPYESDLSVVLDSPLMDGFDPRAIEAIGTKLLYDCRDAGEPVPEKIEYFDSWNGTAGVTIFTRFRDGTPWALQTTKRAA